VGLPVGRLHDRYSEEHFKQITAEQLVAKVVKGYRRTEWQKTRDRNDALDGRCYPRVAAAVCGMDRCNDDTWKTIEDRIDEMAKTGPESRRANR
jgi:phage terminase large subunit GpA-like protein